MGTRQPGADDQPALAPAEEIAAHYASGYEAERLTRGAGQLEAARTREILARYLPPPPAGILDVAAGAGVYALPLARQGYRLHLRDLLPLHVDLALRAAAEPPAVPLASARAGDARAVDLPDASVDAVLLLGPLYHLTDRADRLRALAEARRVLRPGGVVFAAGISRFASLLDGLRHGYLLDPRFRAIVQADLATGQHRNPDNHPDYFTTAYFHRPDELADEVAATGFAIDVLLAVEGPGGFLPTFADWWADDERRGLLLDLIRAVEAEPSLLGTSPHLLVVARRQGG